MTTTMLMVLVGVVAVLAVGAYLFVRSRQATEEPVYHFRCPGCHRRLRYQARQAGRSGSCSHCGKGITFPPISESVE